MVRRSTENKNDRKFGRHGGFKFSELKGGESAKLIDPQRAPERLAQGHPERQYRVRRGWVGRGTERPGEGPGKGAEVDPAPGRRGRSSSEGISVPTAGARGGGRGRGWLGDHGAEEKAVTWRAGRADAPGSSPGQRTLRERGFPRETEHSGAGAGGAARERTGPRERGNALAIAGRQAGARRPEVEGLEAAGPRGPRKAGR